MCDLLSESLPPPRFHGQIQPHTGREADSSDSHIGPGEYVSYTMIADSTTTTTETTTN